MSFNPCIKCYIEDYINNHIESKDDLINEHFFEFIKEKNYRMAVIDQFYSTRQVYKFFEGMHAENELLDSEAKIQVILYISLIEYACDYLLLNTFSNKKTVKKLFESSSLKKINVQEKILKEIAKSISIPKENIVISKKINGKNYKKQLRKIRFQDKLNCIETVLKKIDEKNIKGNPKKINRRYEFRHIVFSKLNKLIYFRNNIHLSHELEANGSAELKDSRSAYKLIKQFSDIINSFVLK